MWLVLSELSDLVNVLSRIGLYGIGCWGFLFSPTILSRMGLYGCTSSCRRLIVSLAQAKSHVQQKTDSSPQLSHRQPDVSDPLPTFSQICKARCLLSDHNVNTTSVPIAHCLSALTASFSCVLCGARSPFASSPN